MYLSKVILKNIKCFSRFELDFAPGNRPRLWTAILGENGLGKSAVLQAIGAALAGPGAMRELLPVAEGWVRTGQPFGEIEVQLLWTEGDALTPHWPKTKTPYIAHYIVTGNEPRQLPAPLSEQYTVPVIVDWPGVGPGREREKVSKDMSRLKQTAYAEGKIGWFSSGYGPFRRLSGGAQAADKILYSRRKSARFVTLFREDAALTDAAEWLISLYNTARDGDRMSERTLEQIKKALAEEFLPEPAELQVNAHSALLRIRDGAALPLRDLSDGYRSMLALGIDLLRWLSNAFPESNDLLHNPGVVLVDELDAHAHPTWQRQIGFWLRRKFPRLQFVVTTHSPFLAQVADQPSGNIVLEQSAEGVQKRQDVESVDTWRADQILTELQGLPITRSPEVERKIQRYEELLSKRSQMSPAEKAEYEQLRLWSEDLPPAIELPNERRQAAELHDAVERHRDTLKELL